MDLQQIYNTQIWEINTQNSMICSCPWALNNKITLFIHLIVHNIQIYWYFLVMSPTYNVTLILSQLKKSFGCMDMEIRKIGKTELYRTYKQRREKKWIFKKMTIALTYNSFIFSSSNCHTNNTWLSLYLNIHTRHIHWYKYINVE